MDAMISHQIFSLTPSAGEVVGRVCVGEYDEDTEKLSLFATARLRTRHLAVRTVYRKCVRESGLSQHVTVDFIGPWELAWPGLRLGIDTIYLRNRIGNRSRERIACVLNRADSPRLFITAPAR